ncbi:CapA family protein [Metabacillus sp. GX 13764]|uniref:CapA family protein n=1 Tax=Metabacillus kandeliae TaxID=2900151 RepID=UPI001E2E1CD3|nr:CapA family protein [Metabacillus kandeliae]MCD7033640.1 CapA family protein [Metabacillus kandeliae]
MKRLLLVFSGLIAIIICFLLFYRGHFLPETVKAAESLPERQNGLIQKSDILIKKTAGIAETSAVFSAIGDVLIHKPLYEDAETRAGHYDFVPMFQDMKQVLSKADLTFANQESIAGGAELGLSTYPAFNSPFEIEDALKYAGIDVAGMANNHALDKGEKGIVNAASHFEMLGIPYVGAYKSPADAGTIRVIEKNGIKFSFLAYTYSTNGYKPPKGKEYLVNYIDKKKIAKDLKEAKKVSDAVVVAMHWGTEYERMPNSGQKELAAFLASQGANLIIGSHPHVLQPAEWLTQTGGNKTLVMYSLGNFLSGQKGEYKTIGGMISVKVKKKTEGNKVSIELEQPDFTPAVTLHDKQHHFRVKKLQDLDKAKADKIKRFVLQSLK